MREILKSLLIIQTRKVDLKSRGNRFREERRLNPFNPLTYLTIVLSIILSIILFGVIGLKDQVDFRNPFKYR